MPAKLSEGDKQLSPIDQLNAGIPLIVETPYGLKVMFQKNGDDLRSGVLGSADLTHEQFKEIIAKQGGINAIVSEVLEAIGFTQKIISGSGTLVSVKNYLKTEDVLSYFSFPKK